jgi:transposase
MLRPTPIGDIPIETARVARLIFPKGNLYMRLRDDLGSLYDDADFTAFFPTHGQPALSPWRLALITVFQFLEGLPDRQAADAVRSRIDWKYALCLELTDPGFDASVLCEFRARLTNNGKEHLLLDKLLTRFRDHGLLKLRGKQRTDSTHVLGAVRRLSRLELIAETLRAALNELATVDPGWLKPHLSDELVQWYGHRVEESRLPKGEAARDQYAVNVGEHGFALLNAVSLTGEHLRSLHKVATLALVWQQQFEVDAQSRQVRWRSSSSIPPAGERPASPYDPDTRFALKRSMLWQGYRVHLSETCEAELPELITNVLISSAPERDVVAVPSIHRALENKNLLPEEHLLDAGYISAEMMTQSRRRFGVDVIGPSKRSTSWQARTRGAFTHQDFKIDWNNKNVLCPQDYLNKSWLETTNAHGTPIVIVEFRRRTCERCPVRARCTRTDPEKAGRSLVLRREVQHTTLESSRLRQETAEWKASYAMRDGIEATISQAVRRFDLRRARYWGEVKVALQAVGTAAALNLVRVDAWRLGVPRGQARMARFVKVAMQA